MKQLLLVFLVTASLPFHNLGYSPKAPSLSESTIIQPFPIKTPYIQDNIISYDTSFLDTLATLGEQLNYEFTGNKDDVITIRSNTWDGFVRPKIILKNEAGVILDERTASSSSYSARIDTFRIASDGLYSFSVSDYNRTQTGIVGISLQRIAPAATPLNTIFEAVYDYPFLFTGQMHLLTFEGIEGEVITLRANNKSEFIRPRLELYSPSGVYLLEKVASSSSYPARIDTFRLPETGNYSLLLMDALGSETGNIALNLHRLSPAYGPARIALNQDTILEIVEHAQFVPLTFEGRLGEIYSFRMSNRSGFVKPAMEFYSPGGQLSEMDISNSSTYPARITTFPLNTYGLHTILTFDDNGTNTGSFGFSIQRLFPSPPLVPFTKDTNVTDYLNREGQMNIHPFYGLEGEMVEITMVTDSGFIRPRLEIYDPEGELLQTQTSRSSSFPAQIMIELSEEGIFPILTMDEVGTNLGKYNLAINGIGSAVTYVLDSTICPSDEIIINETPFNRDNLNGQETFTEGASNGRDSIVIVRLDTFATPIGSFDTTLCWQGSFMFGGKLFDNQNDSDTVCLKNSSVHGCDSMVLVTLDFLGNCPSGLSPVFIPDAFTPNGDGTNDQLVINGLISNVQYQDHELIIFDRYSRVVFQASPYDNKWMGVDMNGQKLPAGTYHLVLDLKIDGQKPIIKNLSILR